MIALLRGLVARRDDDHIVVDVQGVGYAVYVTQPLAASLLDGEEVTLHIHTHVREDALQLFGFPALAERDIYLALNTVTGIGPKLAMSNLSSTTTSELLEAVGSSDVKRLTRIPGIGKKTAQRILVELAEVFKRMSMTADLPLPAGGSRPTGSGFDDLESALRNLGFKPHAIASVIDELNADPNRPTDLQSLLREALRHLR